MNLKNIPVFSYVLFALFNYIPHNYYINVYNYEFNVNLTIDSRRWGVIRQAATSFMHGMLYEKVKPNSL